MRTTTIKLILTAAAVALPWLARPASAQDPDYEYLDYPVVRQAIPTMKELSDQAGENGRKLHVLVDQLSQDVGEEKAAELRVEVGKLLEEQLANKTKMVQVTKSILALPRSNLSDQRIFDILHDTELHSIEWKNENFRKCIRDLSAALSVPIRMHHRVVQLNKVEFSFNRQTADTVLAYICNGFDLRYVVYDGEIVVYKKITPTEERFLEYQKRHPETKLRYWDREGAGGAYTPPEGGGVDLTSKDRQRMDLATLDLDLLQENMLKIWIIEESSERHNQSRIAQKSFEALAPLEPSGDPELDRRNLAEKQKVDKHLRHYLLLELDNSIEEIDICTRVLGKNMVREAGEAALKAMLAKGIPDIDWRNKDLRQALEWVGEQAGMSVEVRGIGKNATLTLDLLLEGGTVGAVIDMINGIHAYTWKVEDGKLVFDIL